MRDLANRKSGPGGPEKYRGVAYSVAKQAEGLWGWKLHPDTAPKGAVISGTARSMSKGTAVDAAHQAIDKMLTSKRR
jgi:hypothetical protein